VANRGACTVLCCVLYCVHQKAEPRVQFLVQCSKLRSEPVPDGGEPLAL
jgi:hypothetical protein